MQATTPQATHRTRSAKRRRLTAELDDIEKRIRACSERQAVNISRVEAIEARNKIADANWEILKRKGLLVESTK